MNKVGWLCIFNFAPKKEMTTVEEKRQRQRKTRWKNYENNMSTDTINLMGSS